MTDDIWAGIKKYYKDTFGFDEELVELMAGYDVALMCASGASNDTIAKFFNIDSEEIKLVLDELLHFSGWDIDLSCNPYSVFVAMTDTYSLSLLENFSTIMKKACPEISDEDMRNAFNVCLECVKIEQKLDIGWV